VIIFQEVTKKYGNDIALDNVSFRIKEGEFASIVGESGAGKSTVLKLLLREELPTEGKVFFKGVDISTYTSSELPLYRRRVAPIFQEFRLLPSKTVFENVAFAMEAAGQPSKEIYEDVPQALDVVGLASFGNRFPHQISGGEKQRVAIARALVQRPELIMADEPTGNLDPKRSREIVNLLLKINELGAAVLLVTHEAAVVNDIQKRVITLKNGKIISDKKRGKYIVS